jgi:hypothetical protein
MPSGNKFVDAIVDSLRQSATNRLDHEFLHGYDEAANLCLTVLSESIDELRARIESGSFLSEAEQLLMSRLMSLREDMAHRLHGLLESESAEEAREVTS